MTPQSMVFINNARDIRVAGFNSRTASVPNVSTGKLEQH